MGQAFNLLLYFVPLILLITSTLGYTLLESKRAMAEVQSVARQLLPHSEQAFADNLEAIIKNRGLLGLAGFCFLLIFSSTLFGSVRHILGVWSVIGSRAPLLPSTSTDPLVRTVADLAREKLNQRHDRSDFIIDRTSVSLSTYPLRRSRAR
jgi:hypothetical protein